MKIVKITSLLMVLILGSSQIVQAYSPLWRYGFSAGTVALSTAAGAAVGRKAAQLCTKDKEQFDKRKNICTIIGGSIGTVLGTVVSYFMWFNKLAPIQISTTPSNPEEQKPGKPKEQQTDLIDKNEKSIEESINEEQSRETNSDIPNPLESSQEDQGENHTCHSLSGSEEYDDKTVIVHNLTGNGDHVLLTQDDNVQISDDVSDHLNEEDLAYEKITLAELKNKLQLLTKNNCDFSIEAIADFDQVEQAYLELETLALEELSECNKALTSNATQGNNYIGRVQQINKLHKEIIEACTKEKMKRDTHCTMTRRFGKDFENSAK